MGYLLLEDGSLFEGKIINGVKNILGKIILDEQDSIKLECHTTGKLSLISTDSDNVNGDVLLSNVDFQSLKKRVEKINKLQGKIVTDSLPIEYHVYDLKTFIPV